MDEKLRVMYGLEDNACGRMDIQVAVILLNLPELLKR